MPSITIQGLNAPLGAYMNEAQSTKGKNGDYFCPGKTLSVGLVCKQRPHGIWGRAVQRETQNIEQYRAFRPFNRTLILCTKKKLEVRRLKKTILFTSCNLLLSSPLWLSVDWCNAIYCTHQFLSFNLCRSKVCLEVFGLFNEIIIPSRTLLIWKELVWSFRKCCLNVNENVTDSKREIIETRPLVSLFILGCFYVAWR